MGLFDWFKGKAKPTPQAETLVVSDGKSVVKDPIGRKPVKIVKQAKPDLRSEKLVERDTELIPIEDVQESKTAPKLPSEAQTVICRLLGQFRKNKEIVEYIERKFQIKLTSAAITFYTRSREWSSLVNRHRQEYLENIESIPIKHKKIRLERMEALYEQALSEPANVTHQRRDKRREVLDILRQAKAEEADIQQTNIISLQGLSDADLLKRVEELRAKVTKLGGKLDAAQRGLSKDGEAPTEAEIVVEGVDSRLATQQSP